MPEKPKRMTFKDYKEDFPIGFDMNIGEMLEEEKKESDYSDDSEIKRKILNKDLLSN